jgi:hypothetical protein
MLLKFAIKELGPAHHILRMKRSRGSEIAIVPSVLVCLYIRQILERFSMHTARSATPPLPINFRLSRKDSPTPSSDGDHMKLVPYTPDVGSTIHTRCWLIDAHNGRDANRHCAYSWHCQQIYTQSWPTTLKCNEAFLQISCWHTRPRHHFRTRWTLKPSWLHQLGLHGLLRQPKIDVRIFLQVRTRCHFVEIETTGLCHGKSHDSKTKTWTSELPSYSWGS